MSRRDWVGQALRGQGLPGDVLLAGLLYTGEVLLWLLTPAEYRAAPLQVTMVWGALGTATIALRRVRPWFAVTILAAHTVAPFLVSTSLGPLGTATSAIVVVTYTAAAIMPLRQALAAAAVIWLPALIAAVAVGANASGPLPLPPAYFLAANLMTAAVCFFVGRTVCNRRAYVAALEDRARTDEATQQALTARAVADERRRIARELHDVVAHHVSVMGVLATGSRRTLARDPAAADEALATIEETGRTALREMRRLLNVLRTDESEPAGELAPQPGLAGIEVLVEQIREAGLPATLRVDGEPVPMDPGVALTVYRIVQEALTNALKHAGSASVEVRLTFDRVGLTVEVCDTGRGPRSDSPMIGHGLLGMRERVSLYGGTLRTGPRPGGGYRVFAKIPLDDPHPDPRPRLAAPRAMPTGAALEPGSPAAADPDVDVNGQVDSAMKGTMA